MLQYLCYYLLFLFIYIFFLAYPNLIDMWGEWSTFETATVQGTKSVLAAAQQAKIQRFIHVSTEAVLADGPQKLHNADETFPLSINGDESVYPYTVSKARAEQAVKEANHKPDNTFNTIVCSPRFIWGKDDTVLLPGFIKAAKSGDLKWFDGKYIIYMFIQIYNITKQSSCKKKIKYGVLF